MANRRRNQTPPPPPCPRPYPDWKRKYTDQLPWKYVGYRVFSKWVASDRSYFIVRRFGALNARVILSLQDELVELDQRIQALDEAWSRKRNMDDTNNGSFRFDPCDERRYLVQEILPRKLLEYNQFINEYSKLVERPDVAEDDVRKVKTWFDDNHPSAIEEPEAEYIKHMDDLIPVHPKIKSRFRKFLEWILLRIEIPFISGFFEREPDDFDIIRDDQTVWDNDKRLERFSSIVVALFGLAMLTGPLWILENHATRPAVRLGIITGFIAAFFVFVAVATTARINEALAAAAAYSALLMVFYRIAPF